MHRTYSSFLYHGSKLHYSVFGRGEKVLFMFHGFGQTHKSLRLIEEALQNDYRIYSFDLFFHGFSEWNHNDSPLSYDFWQKMLESFLEENEINKFDLLGFSIGAKVCLATAELFSDRVEQLYLLAPDGIKRSFVYECSTWPPFRSIFRNLILRPQLFQNLVQFLAIFRIVDKSVLRFASLQMNSREKRRRVYYTWTVYKGLRPNLDKLIQQFNHRSVLCHVFVGRYDRIVQLKQIQFFTSRLNRIKLAILNAGHNNLLDVAATHISKELSKR